MLHRWHHMIHFPFVLQQVHNQGITLESWSASENNISDSVDLFTKLRDVFDRQLLMVSQITLLVGIIFSFKITSTYSVVQYVVSALVTFVSAEVLEGETSEKHFFFLECSSTAHFFSQHWINRLNFVSANAGVNLSLLSSVMSSRLSRGTYNGGLLSTEAGTLARVVADCTITAAGYLGIGKLLNVTLLPSLVICAASIASTFLTYNSLFWWHQPVPWWF